MKTVIQKPWFAIAGFFIAVTIDKFIFRLFSIDAQFYLHDITDWLYALFTLLFIYSIGWNIIQTIKSWTGHQSPEASTYADDKEKELLRKQNEILVHLLQDEHREEGR